MRILAAASARCSAHSASALPRGTTAPVLRALPHPQPRERRDCGSTTAFRFFEPITAPMPPRCVWCARALTMPAKRTSRSPPLPMVAIHASLPCRSLERGGRLRGIPAPNSGGWQHARLAAIDQQVHRLGCLSTNHQRIETRPFQAARERSLSRATRTLHPTEAISRQHRIAPGRCPDCPRQPRKRRSAHSRVRTHRRPEPSPSARRRSPSARGPDTGGRRRRRVRRRAWLRQSGRGAGFFRDIRSVSFGCRSLYQNAPPHHSRSAACNGYRDAEAPHRRGRLRGRRNPFTGRGRRSGGQVRKRDRNRDGRDPRDTGGPAIRHPRHHS